MTRSIKIIFILIAIIQSFQYCKSDIKRNNKVIASESFDEKNFVEKQNFTNRVGQKISSISVNKFDTNFVMYKKWWDNDSVLSSMYFRKNKKFGPFKIYDDAGRFTFEGFYLNDKRNGVALSYFDGELISIEVYDNDILYLIESKEREALITMLRH